MNKAIMRFASAWALVLCCGIFANDSDWILLRRDTDFVSPPSEIQEDTDWILLKRNPNFDVPDSFPPPPKCRDIEGFRESAEFDFRVNFCRYPTTWVDGRGITFFTEDTNLYINLKDSSCLNFSYPSQRCFDRPLPCMMRVYTPEFPLVPAHCDRPLKTVNTPLHGKRQVLMTVQRTPSVAILYRYDSGGEPCIDSFRPVGGDCEKSIPLPFLIPTDAEIRFIKTYAPEPFELYEINNDASHKRDPWEFEEWSEDSISQTLFLPYFFNENPNDENFPLYGHLRHSPKNLCCSSLQFDFLIQSTEGDIYHLEWCSFYDKEAEEFRDYFIYKAKNEECSKGFYPEMENNSPVWGTSTRMDFTPAYPYCLYDIPQPED